VFADLSPARHDLAILRDYLLRYECFDELIILENSQVTPDNLRYFLETYFPERLAKAPKSRFLFAYSGHGTLVDTEGYLVRYSAHDMHDPENQIALADVRKSLRSVIRSGHHVLVLINACYSGAFFKQGFDSMVPRLVPQHPGAHAITAGGTHEPSWHDGKLGPGSVFFEKLMAGLGGEADVIPKGQGDGIVTATELAAYLQAEVSLFTGQGQNPCFGDIGEESSTGSFFFINRDRPVKTGEMPEWNSSEAVAMGFAGQDQLRQAVIYYRQRSYDKAMVLFADAATAGDAYAMFALGYMYMSGRAGEVDCEKAVEWYMQAAEAGNAEAMFYLGLLYFDGLGVPNDFRLAAEWFRKASQADNPLGMVYLGYLYEVGAGVKQSYGDAVVWYQRAAFRGDGLAMMSLSHLYENGLGVEPNALEAKRWMEKGLAATRAIDARLFEEIPRIDDTSIDLYMHVARLDARGGLYNKMGRHEDAIRDLTKALELGRQPPQQTYYRRGFAYRSIGDLESALKDFQKVVEANPESWKGHSSVGETQRLLGNFDEAVDHLLAALAKAGDTVLPVVHASLGGAYYSRGDYSEAIAALTTALDTGYEQTWWALTVRGASSHKLGKNRAALQDLDKAVHLAPDYAWAYEIRSQVHKKLLRYRLAREDEERAQRLRSAQK
jgi:TPR repeat protein